MRDAITLLVMSMAVIPLPATAESTMPTVIALQTKQEQVFDLRDVGNQVGSPDFPDQLPHWNVASSSQVTVRKLDATRFAIVVNAKGRQTFRFQPSGAGHGIPIPVVGYELDRSGLYAPAIVDDNPSDYDSAKPTTMTATLRMDPFVPGVQYDLTFFAHKTTFVHDARSFRVVTRDASTSLGEAGFRVENGADVAKIGVLEFTMIMPSGEQSWCLRTTQTQQWAALITGPAASN